MIDLLQLFLTHLQGYKRQAVWSPILIVVEVICELLLPLVMAEIVDTAIPAGDETYIFQLGAVMLVLAGVAMLCGVLAAKYSAFASQGFGANLRQCLFDKVQEFSFADIDRFSSASLITRMTNDVNALLVEVGGHGNTLQEAIAGARLFAQSIGQVLKTMEEP